VGCDYFHGKHHSVEVHDKKHKEMDANMQMLGWFWGSVRTMIQANAAITIREAIGEGSVFQCGAEDCEKIFASKTNLSRHYSQDHP
jgi:hypothetical protein